MKIKCICYQRQVWNLSWKKWTKKELELQLEQPCHRLLPSKLCILKNRPKWLLAVTFGKPQRMGLLRGREKMVYWYMLLFLLCFLSSFYHFLSFIPFLLSFFLIFLFFIFFLVFTTKASTTVFGLLWTSLQGCPPIHWLPNHYHYWVNSIHSLPLLIPWQNLSLFVLFFYLYLWVQMDKD